MRQKHVIGFLLLVISIIGIIYSYFMDISNSGVVNLSKISDRQFNITFFGFIFISSIIMLNDYRGKNILKYFFVFIWNEMTGKNRH